MDRREYKVEDITTSSDEFTIRLLDGEGNPMANASYKVLFDGGTELSGTTDEDGVGRHKDAPSGDFEVIFGSEDEERDAGETNEEEGSVVGEDSGEKEEEAGVEEEPAKADEQEAEPEGDESK